MVKIVAAIVSAVLLAGCAPQQATPERVEAGRYPNYRAMLQSEAYSATRNKDHARCVGDWMVANVSPADLAQLDRYARGEVPFSAIPHERLSAAMTARTDGQTGKEMLRPYCPDKVDSFRFPG